MSDIFDRRVIYPTNEELVAVLLRAGKQPAWGGGSGPDELHWRQLACEINS